MKRTLNNLVRAFVGENLARTRYTFYATIAKVFQEIAEQEKEHAETLIELINELGKRLEEEIKSIKVEVEVPIILGNTIENLKNAISSENFEYTKMYPEFAKIAEEEGLHDIAHTLRAIAKAEEHHEERFKKILEELEKKTMFKKDREVFWTCIKCGYVHYGIEPPEKCPSCGHLRNYFIVKQ